MTVSGTNLFAGIEYGGVWKRPLSEMTSIDYTSMDLPTQFALGQNYPNPFNPSTVISYELPTSSEVKLEVYDMLGRKIKTIVSQRQNAGAYSVTFNATTLSSGFYFYRLTAGDFVNTRKMILIK